MTERTLSAIERIEGTALPLPGDDIDTDRIIPARFLVSVTFEGLGEHAFEDDRRARAGTKEPHPFDEAAFQGAAFLLVNRNFGCGSSREHAPQALYRRGFRAVVGESFSEIFFGNSVAIGLPCVTMPHETAVRLQRAAGLDPGLRLVLDLSRGHLRAGKEELAVGIPDGVRGAFVTGRWDATSLLLERFEEVEAVARRLPYVTGF